MICTYFEFFVLFFTLTCSTFKNSHVAKFLHQCTPWFSTSSFSHTKYNMWKVLAVCKNEFLHFLKKLQIAKIRYFSCIFSYSLKICKSKIFFVLACLFLVEIFLWVNCFTNLNLVFKNLIVTNIMVYKFHALKKKQRKNTAMEVQCNSLKITM